MSRCVIMMKLSCQSPVAHSCGLLNHLSSFYRGRFKLTAKFDADSLLYSLSFWMWWLHSTHAHSTSTTPHWLVQWNHHCSCMCLPVHSPWLPGYINVTQTIVVILTMTGLFLERHCIYSYHLCKIEKKNSNTKNFYTAAYVMIRSGLWKFTHTISENWMEFVREEAVKSVR